MANQLSEIKQTGGCQFTTGVSG